MTVVGIVPALAFPAAFLNLMQGQTGFFSVALIGGGLLLLSSRPVIGGILLGVACFKPHLCLLLPLVMIAGRQWRALVAAGITGLVLVAASLLAFGPAPWIAMLGHLPTATAFLEDGVVPWTKMPSPFAASRLAGATIEWAYTAQAAAALVGTLAVVGLWWRRPGTPMTIAATLCATLLVPPHVNDHDLVLWAVPFALIIREGVRHGWLTWEREVLLCIGATPLCLAPFAAITGLNVGPLALAAVLVLVLCRAVR